MEWLNYHHLQYFWVVAQEGSISAAVERLALSQPTISTQIKKLEDSLGEPLFDRHGKRLVLNDFGQTVYRYADEIFSLGQEMMQALKGQAIERPLRLQVGIADVVPKLIAHRLIQIALDGIENLEVHCEEGRAEDLLSRLALHQLDLVINDKESPHLFTTTLYDHLLGTSGITFFASTKVIKQHGKTFPACLDGAPILMPGKESSLRKDVEAWLTKNKLFPRLVAEFDDSALMKVFGRFGNGYFFGPTVLKKDIEQQYNVKGIGELPKLQESFYAISAERKVIHPAVLAITTQAKSILG